MKKNILSMAALLMASAAVFTACSSDDNITSEQPANPTGKYTMTVKASKGGDATTRALTLDGKTLNATWNENEEVLVYQNGSQIGTLRSAASTTNETTLTGELSAPDANQDLTLYFHTATDPATTDDAYAGQDGTLETIASTYDFCEPATITAGNFTVSGSTVSTTGSVSFGANQQAIVKFTLTDKATGSDINATELVISVGATDYTITRTSPTNVIYAAIPGFTDKTVKLTTTVGDNTYTYVKARQSFTNGQYYEITVKTKPDLLSGVFSVSDSKKVKFSKGNLRNASTKWSFFNNQYEYYNSYSADAWDHFGWSTAATTYGMNTSTDNVYSGDFKDWGETMGTGWFTLSKDEWTYLFNTRSASTVNGTENGHYAKATVNKVQGVILFPDTYTHPAGVTAPTNVNTGNVSFDSNSYNVAAWTKMESAGCVFLPAAGTRSGSTVETAGTYGYYWSAESYNEISAYNVGFPSSFLNPASGSRRKYGYSVRLVRQVE